MRKQIAAANWKMNLTLQEGETLLDTILSQIPALGADQQVVFAVAFPYLPMALAKTKGYPNVFIAAQNLANKAAGAYTGEVAASMLASLNVPYVLIGHSERREYYGETNQILAEKTELALANKLKPIFCCGEPLEIREANTQNEFVARQLEESLFHLNADALGQIVIAYEPIWAIGTGKTASSQQADEIQAHIRSVFATKYGASVADSLTILYGGSVNAANAETIFAEPNVDGGLVGGASLKANDFVAIVKALKK